MRLALSILLLLGALWAVSLWRAAAREAAVEAAYPPSGQFVTLQDGCRVHAVVAGSGPDLVLIHGAGGSVRDWSFAMIPALQARYRVIALDRPGFGWSDPLPADADGLEDQARALAEAAALLGAERPVVLGHSYGGAVAAAWAVHLPDRMAALVMLSGVSHVWSGGIDTIYEITGRPVGAALVVPMLTAWVPDSYIRRALSGVFAPQAQPAGYYAHFGPVMSLRRQTFRINARQRVALWDEVRALMPGYRDLPMPVEILHGTADLTVGVNVHAVPLSQAAPDADLHLLEGIGHMPQHSAMPEVIAGIDRAAARAGLR